MRRKLTILPVLALGLIAAAGALNTGITADAANNAMLAAPEVGQEMSGWTFKDPEGVAHSLEDYRGKVVVLDFWATWCGPCRKIMPEMQKLHEKYQDRGVVVIGMNGGERGGDPAAFMKKKGINYTLLLNTEPAMQSYGVTGIPAFFVIDAEGKLAWKGVGGARSTHEKLVRAVERELDKIKS